MRLGIVGSEGAKFTPEAEETARMMIRDAIRDYGADTVVSGGCHLGGIDIWAVEEAKKMGGIQIIEFLPAKRTWSGGYKERNILIAKNSDAVVCIAVKQLPPDFKGIRFELCYHCGTTDHVKSGGCWTTKYARKLGKPGVTLVVCSAIAVANHSSKNQ